MRKRIVFLIFTAYLLTIPPGCWDIKDVNNTAFAITIGIDKPHDPSTAKYLVTIEFVKPLLGQSNPGNESLTVSVESDSILQAIQRLQSDISRKISLSHLRVVVIGEEIAKERDFKDLSDYLMREPKVALRLRLIFVQDGQARDLFYSKYNFEKLLGSEIVALGQSQEELSIVRTNNFLEFINDLMRTKGTAFGSRVAVQGPEKMIVRDGAAVYKNWKLTSWLNAEEAQEANWLINKTHPLVLARDGNNIYTYQVSKCHKKIIPVYSNGNISFLVKINTDGMVLEKTGTELDFSKPNNLKKMENLFVMAIKQQVRSALEKSQNDIKADYLGFSKAFQQYYPEVFKSMDWNKVYPEIPVDVQVECKVRAYGMRS